MTPNKAIEYIDNLRPNAYSEEDKLNWINELDGMVQKLVFQEEETTTYKFPDDMDRELLISAPFDNVYALYLESKIHYYNQEYGNYNNSVAMFESQFGEYKKAYIRKHQARG